MELKKRQVFVITNKNYDTNYLNRIRVWIKHGNEVHLLYVIQPLPAQYMQLPDAQAIVDELRSEAKRRLKEISDALELDASRSHVAMGLVNAVAHDIANRLNAAVIHLSKHSAPISMRKIFNRFKNYIRKSWKEMNSIFSLSHAVLTSTWQAH